MQRMCVPVRLCVRPASALWLRYAFVCATVGIRARAPVTVSARVPTARAVLLSAQSTACANSAAPLWCSERKTARSLSLCPSFPLARTTHRDAQADSRTRAFARRARQTGTQSRKQGSGTRTHAFCLLAACLLLPAASQSACLLACLPARVFLALALYLLILS